MISRDIAANFVGRSCSMLMGVAFVPVYLATLGAEGYGLIGFYVTLQAVLIIADFGLSWTITRELAQARANAADARQVASLLRTTEIAYWTISLLIGVTILMGGGALAARWFQLSTLPAQDVEVAVRLIGAVLILQMPSLFYQGALNGFDRQPTTNLIAAGTATLRWAGGAFVVWLVSPTIQAFFAWQVFAAGLGTCTAAWAAWRNVPGFSRARFDARVLHRVWRFASGVMASAAAGVLAMQVDKLLVSKLVSLEAFGYYSLAVLIASLLPALVTPLQTAIYPRLSEFHAQRNIGATSELYHTSAQLLAVLVVPAAMVLAFFPSEILLTWTGDAATARIVAPLVSLLAVGNLVYSLTGIPSLLLIASGRPDLSAWTLAALAAAILPSLMLVVPRFGLFAAVVVSLVASSAYILVIVPVTHHCLLRGQLARWSLWSAFIPVAVAAFVFAVARQAIPADATLPVKLTIIVAAWLAAALWLVFLLPGIRHRLKSLIASRFKAA